VLCDLIERVRSVLQSVGVYGFPAQGHIQDNRLSALRLAAAAISASADTANTT
jgi:hypothetical protein